MNRPPDDEYGSLQDLLGDSPYDDPGDDSGDDYAAADPGAEDAADDPGTDDAAADTSGDLPDPPRDSTGEPATDPAIDPAIDPAGSDLWRGLPAGMPPEYAEAFRRGYERARRGEDLDEPSGEEPTQEIRLPQREASGPWAEPEREAPGPQAEPEREASGPRAEPERFAPDPEAETEAVALHHAEREQQPTEPDWAEPEQAGREQAGREQTGREQTGPEQTRPEQTGPGQPWTEPVEPTRRIDRSALAGIGPPAATPSNPPKTNPPPTNPPPGPPHDTSSSDAESFHERGGSGSAQALLAKLVGPHGERDPRRLAAVLAAVALVVVLAAFGLGRLFAEDGSGSAADTQGQASGEQGGQQQSPYQGAVRPVPVAAARATCQTGSSVDAAGNQVTYEPAKAHDANLSTAWRCDGSGKGQRLTITLPRKTVVAQVGLVPGYAKTDPASGVDRYAENNRITKVRWRFDDGSTVVQRMSGNAVNRSMRLKRLPETSTRRVVLEILASAPGTRNTVAISELRIAAPRG